MKPKFHGHLLCKLKRCTFSNDNGPTFWNPSLQKKKYHPNGDVQKPQQNQGFKYSHKTQMLEVMNSRDN
jgi:hypothetical protein